MKPAFIILLLCYSVLVQAQAQINLPLKHKLDSIYVLDQKYRAALTALNSGGKADSIAALFNRPAKGLQWFLISDMPRVDSLNMLKIRSVIKIYGYPGKSLVGELTNEVAWNVIQHSPHIKEYIRMVEKAAKHKEIPFTLYAKMQDRLLVEEGKEQIYGTQIQGLSITNKNTGKQEMHMFVWPIYDASKVNALRKKAGFDQSIEAYAKTFGVTYLRMSLAEVEALRK
ncbi:DUF6624 domain-containing protein [Mucilaginibacter sp. CSA2-8R]|uniref:DUF6624 domain-containing protein n=1 Tax=Mucilaginibacter sp. CSA2-8R TaxID=3141542 RepID=UPI00315CF443